MPSRFITLLSIGIFIAIVALTIHYIEYHKKKDKSMTIKKIVFKCSCCNKTETYNNIDIKELPKLYPCSNQTCSCEGMSRNIIEMIK